MVSLPMLISPWMCYRIHCPTVPAQWYAMSPRLLCGHWIPVSLWPWARVCHIIKLLGYKCIYIFLWLPSQPFVPHSALLLPVSIILFWWRRRWISSLLFLVLCLLELYHSPLHLVSMDEYLITAECAQTFISATIGKNIRLIDTLQRVD